ncbi:helix-turn-helix transcriptional regulator [Isoptericola sp. BMS4]|uniref:helix-turn-helix domain-containing protein n=1 Tax=Isoptericola sp. BMS4 TaxID=2527875 RepID=UPI002729735A|nr:helix-turn-helix transcriptional regulator [Isoptericola sp. BMS4]
MTSTPDGPATLPAGARPAAPHVARRVARLVGDDRVAVAETLARLSPEQVAGQAALPDPLPVAPAVRAAVEEARLHDAARRVVLAAGVLVLDRVDVLLGATGAPVEHLLVPPLVDHLRPADGRFRRVDPRVRAVVHEDAGMGDRTRVHADLAAELDRAGEPEAARWHSALSTLAGDPALADGLVRLAEDRLLLGGTVTAHAIAREAASHGTGEVRARAFLAAGRAALLSGHLDDAAAWLDRVTSTGVASVHDDAERARGAVRALGGPGARVGIGAGPEPPGTTLARMVVPVAQAAVSPADIAALVAVVDALARLERDPQAVDAVLARAVVSAVPAREPCSWDERGAVLSPLAEAHLRVVQALALLRSGDGARAGHVLAEAAARLPVAQVGGGLAAAVAGCVPDGEELAESLRAVGTAHVPAASAVCRADSSRPDPGAAVVRSLVGVACVGADDRVAAEPGRPGGGVWERWADVLTSRELDVARLVAEGLANRQVADRLCVSVRTVEVHLGRVFRKVGVGSRAELTVRALSPAS